MSTSLEETAIFTQQAYQTYDKIMGVARLSTPGGQERNIASIFSSFSYILSHFPSICLYFLLKFGPPGGRLAHLGRPWLRHWMKYTITMHFNR